MMRDEAKKTIHQFNAGVSTAELDALDCESAFFYAIDPDNTLVVCFDSSGKAVKAYFGGQ
jgi:hypothetical protein